MNATRISNRDDFPLFLPANTVQSARIVVNGRRQSAEWYKETMAVNRPFKFYKYILTQISC